MTQETRCDVCGLRPGINHGECYAAHSPHDANVSDFRKCWERGRDLAASRAEAFGRAAERGAVVAWLRHICGMPLVAAAIERGEHGGKG